MTCPGERTAENGAHAKRLWYGPLGVNAKSSEVRPETVEALSEIGWAEG